MRKIKVTLFVFLLILFFNACKKESDNNNQNVDLEVYDYIITLNPDKSVFSIKRFEVLNIKNSSDYSYNPSTMSASNIQRLPRLELESYEDYFYTPNTITIIRRSKYRPIGKSTYFRENNLITKCTDTFFYKKDTFNIVNTIYSHNAENQIIERKSHQIEIMSDSIRENYKDYITTYNYNNGNNTSILRGSNKCKETFEYNNLIPALNINNIEENMIGITSKNLVSFVTVSLSSSCPPGPGGLIPATRFIYRLNSENYVTQAIELNFITKYNLSTGYTLTKKVINNYKYIK